MFNFHILVLYNADAEAQIECFEHMYDKGKLNSFSFRNAPITLEIEISNINLWHMVVWKIVWLLCICCCQYPSSTLWGHYDTLLINVPHLNNTVLSIPCFPGWPDPDNLDQRWLTHEQSTFSVQVIIYTRLQDVLIGLLRRKANVKLSIRVLSISMQTEAPHLASEFIYVRAAASQWIRYSQYWIDNTEQWRAVRPNN